MYLKSSPNQNETYELILSIHKELLVSLILKFYYDQFLPAMSEKPLLNGENIIHQFQLPPCLLFGKILNDIQKAQVLGKTTSSNDAIALAGNIIQSQN